MRKAFIGVGLLAAVVFASRSVAALVIETASSERLTGAVLSVSEDGLTFLEERQRDQPGVIKSGDLDDVFQAQGHETFVRRIPFAGMTRIGGVPPDAFRVLWKSNLLHRVFSEFEAGRILVTTQGTFLEQVRSVVVFLALLFVALPLALMLVSWPFPGERLGVLGAVGFVLLLSVLGFGVARLSVVLAGMGGALATPTAHIALTILFALIVATFVHWGSRFNFLQGLLFALVWGAGLFFIARITARLVGIPFLEGAV